MTALAFSLPDDERWRLMGGGSGPRERREGRYDPMDALLWAAVLVIVCVTAVYTILFLRTAFDPDFEPPTEALQGLVLVVPIASGVVLLKRERRNGD